MKTYRRTLSFSDASLQELVMYLPATEAELERINGFGEVKVKRYGQVILEQIISYCKPLGLTSQLPATSLKKKREKSSPGETHFKTLELLQSGKTIDEIASARGLAPGTIESHLDKLIKMGKLRAKEVVSENRINEILKVLSNTQDVGLRPIKEQLPEDFSYGEIRMVVSDHQLNPK